MKKIIAAAVLAVCFTQAASAASSLGSVGSILQKISEMNNERLQRTEVRQTKKTGISGATGGAQVLEYVVSLFEDDGANAFGEETYLVIVDNGLNVQSIQKVLTVENK